jgi:hypothetical protein
VLENREHIDDLFADYLTDYEEKAPEYVWKNIQAELCAKRSHKRIILFRTLAASLALLLAFGLGYYSSDNQHNKYLVRNFELNPDSVLGLEKIKTKKASNLSVSNLHKKTDKKEIEEIPSENNEYAKNKESIKNGYLLKFFELPQNVLSKYAEMQKNLTNSTSGKRINENKSSNQLLIDTLLFKKENLSERGFLLTEKKVHKSKWSISTKFSPVYSVNENISESTKGADRNISHSIKSSEIPETSADEKALLSFSGGFNVNYHLTNRWSIESGLFYSQHRQMADNIVSSSIYGTYDEMTVYTPDGIRYIKPSDAVQPGNSKIIGTALGETYYSLDLDYISNFEYIELPIILRYKIIDRKLGLDVHSGFSTNFLIANRSSVIYNDNDLWSGSEDAISPMLYNATIGLGLNYDIFNNFSLNIEPTFRYSIITSKTNSLLRYPYSFAVFAGFSFRF